MDLGRRRALAAAAACCAASAFARLSPPPLALWAAPASHGGLDVQAIFLEAFRSAAPASHELEAVAAAGEPASAQVRVAPRIDFEPRPGDQSRLSILTHIDFDSPGRLRLECRTETSVVLPNRGEGGWNEDGLYALRGSLKRCARDLTVLLQTELSMRRRGYWSPQVGRERLLAVQLETERSPHACLVIRETGPTLFLADADADGRISDNRLIVDKPLLVDRS